MTEESSEGLGGLTDAEVAERVAEGRTNANTDVRTKSVAQILSEHTFTLFNGVNLALALLVLLTGQYRNMLFMCVVAANLLIGVAQEIRAKRMVDRLTILTQKEVTVIRAAGERALPPSELVADDLVRLAHGDQVPADAVIVSGHVSMNESLLTGESKPVTKGPGDELLSGSFVDSGSLVARVTRVGAEGYAARINAEAKYVKAVRSEIQDTLRAIIKLGTIALVPLGVGLFLRSVLMDGGSLEDAVLTSVAAVIGMIPQGLVLLTSSVLAIATFRLGRRMVLVQQSYCVETLARVDTLCLDKTGTITTGEMEVSGVRAAAGSSAGDVERALAAIVSANAEDANETARAILAHLEGRGVRGEGVARAVAFSSERKFSGCVTESGRALVMGAAAFVLGPDRASEADALTGALDATERVLVVGEALGFDAEGHIEGSVRLLGCVAIRDEIRPTAAETMRFFLEQGVELRVISGDDPRTVSAIAERAGVPNAGSYVDATTLDTPEKLDAAVDAARVFGRVTPQQKRELVRALHRRGRTVAMTGDGVNDVLALREADCSVAMASGSAAARNVSEIRARRQRLRAHARGRRGGAPLHQQPPALGFALSREDRLHGGACPRLHRDAPVPVHPDPDVAALDRDHRHSLVRARPRAQPRARARAASSRTCSRGRCPASAAIVVGAASPSFIVGARARALVRRDLDGVHACWSPSWASALVWRISQPHDAAQVRRCSSVDRRSLLRAGVRSAPAFFENCEGMTGSMGAVTVARGRWPAVAWLQRGRIDRSLAGYETERAASRASSGRRRARHGSNELICARRSSAARRPVTRRGRAASRRLAHVVSGIPGAERLPRALRGASRERGATGPRPTTTRCAWPPPSSRPGRPGRRAPRSSSCPPACSSRTSRASRCSSTLPPCATPWSSAAATRCS